MQKLCDVVVEVKKATKSHGRKKGKSKSKTVICPLLSSFASRAAHEPKLSKLVAMNMNVDDIELVETSLDMDNPPFAGPVHNSIDSGGSYNEYCVVRIRDDGSGTSSASDPQNDTSIHSLGGDIESLKSSLRAISSEYLGNHDCLGVSNIEQQSLGGPTRGDDGSPEFIWIQWCVWFPDQDSSAWSDVRLVNFCMVLCLPTADEAGTLITNFVGPRDLVDHISTVCTEQVTNIHPLGIKSLQIWGIYPNSNQASTAILIGGREEKAAPKESVEIGGHEGAGEDKATAKVMSDVYSAVRKFGAVDYLDEHQGHYKSTGQHPWRHRPVYEDWDCDWGACVYNRAIEFAGWDLWDEPRRDHWGRGEYRLIRLFQNRASCCNIDGDLRCSVCYVGVR
ncbi:hypothetical protein V496_05579 [Pseudogymnoascus sp. VKM F-4515 (FW-2607)]|nr:hypothetical protein V496_05579 [Pseudogymnoascus sp. VKM F-4515 (FW-2607)]